MTGLVGTSEVAHDEERPGVQEFGLAVVPFGRLEAQTVHAGIELNAEGVGGSVRSMA